jgi:hypothetical protein
MSAQAMPAPTERRAYRIQQRCVRMTKPMPVHSHQTDFLAGGFELPIQEIVTIECASSLCRENQSVGIHARWPSSKQNLDRF